MTFLQKILEIMDTEMQTPGLYGWFHLLWLGLTAAFTVVLCLTHKKEDTDRVRRVVLVTTLVVVALEIYKQINYSFGYTDGIKFDYQWYIFPFQFCSTPMYIGLLAGLTRKGKIHSAACAYLATYAMFAGICVMLYPSTVFISTIGINIQTMICHGAMIAIGIYLLYSGYVKIQWKTLLRAAAVFAILVSMAAIMNEVAYRAGLLETEDFNMFFISPYSAPHLPVYSLVQGIVPFPVSLLIYIAGFTAAAALILLIAKGVAVVSQRTRTKQFVQTH